MLHIVSFKRNSSGMYHDKLHEKYAASHSVPETQREIEGMVRKERFCQMQTDVKMPPAKFDSAGIFSGSHIRTGLMRSIET